MPTQEEEEVAAKSILEEHVLVVQSNPPSSPSSGIKFTIKNAKKKLLKETTAVPSASLTAPNSVSHSPTFPSQNLLPTDQPSSVPSADELAKLKQRRSTPVKLQPLGQFDDEIVITKQEIEKFTIQRKKPKNPTPRITERKRSLLRQPHQVKTIIKSKVQNTCKQIDSTQQSLDYPTSPTSIVLTIENAIYFNDQDLFYGSEDEQTSSASSEKLAEDCILSTHSPSTTLSENNEERNNETKSAEEHSVIPPSTLHTLLYERNKTNPNRLQQGLFHQVNFKGSIRKQSSKQLLQQRNASFLEHHEDVQSLYQQHKSNTVYQWNEEKQRYVAIFKEIVAWKTFDFLDEVAVEEQFFSKQHTSTLSLFFPNFKNELEWEKETILQETRWKSWYKRVVKMLQIFQIKHREQVILQRQKKHQQENESKPQRKYSKLEFQQKVIAQLQPTLETVLLHKRMQQQHYTPPVILSTSTTTTTNLVEKTNSIPIIMQPIDDLEMDSDTKDWNQIVSNTTKKVEGISRRNSALPNYFSLKQLCTTLLQFDDTILVEGFCMTCSSIGTPYELLQHLFITFCHLQEEKKGQVLEMIVRLLQILLHWITYSMHLFLNEEQTMNFLHIILRHIAQCKEEQVEDSLHSFLNTLGEIVHERFCIKNGAQQRLVYTVDLQPTIRFSIIHFPASVLAMQLTLLEQDMFCLVKPEELLASAWIKNKSQAPHVIAIIKKFNIISQWTIWSIISCNTVWDRAQVLSQWILLAWECLQLRNFCACFEIVSGLISNPVYRLQRTWYYLSKHGRNLCDTLQRLTHVGHNYRNYRVALQEAATPLLPDMAVHLKDLASLDDAQPSKRTQNQQQETIEEFNMTKREMQSTILKQLWDYQSVRYPFEPDEKVRKFLWYELMKSGERDAKEFYAEMMRLSKQLESK